jgi:hypothetical protein
LVELFFGHRPSEILSRTGRRLIPSREGARIPYKGGDIVQRNALAAWIEVGKVGLCTDQILLCRQLQKTSGLSVITLNDNTVEIEIGKIVLCMRTTGIS